MSADITAVIVALAVALVFLFANMKSGETWLKVVTIAGFLGFAGLASVVALRLVWAVLS